MQVQAISAGEGKMVSAASEPLDGGQSRRQVVGRRTAVVPVHRGYSLWIQVRGGGNVIAREGRFRLRAGEWIVLDRGLAVEADSRGCGMMLGLVLGSDTLAGKNLSSGSESGLLPGRGRMTRPQLREVLRLWRTVPEAAACMGVLSRIVALESGYDSTIARCPGRSIGCKRRVFARMQRAHQFLEGNRHRIVRLEELARLTSFSSWYLSKKFHEIYQESPQEASVRLRLEHAKELLVETCWPIKRIAIDCGFDNCGSFGRAFRRMFDQTPSAYRLSAAALSMAGFPPTAFSTAAPVAPLAPADLPAVASPMHSVYATQVTRAMRESIGAAADFACAA